LLARFRILFNDAWDCRDKPDIVKRQTLEKQLGKAEIGIGLPPPGLTGFGQTRLPPSRCLSSRSSLRLVSHWDCWSRMALKFEVKFIDAETKEVKIDFTEKP
jgi:hypothetical protein